MVNFTVKTGSNDVITGISICNNDIITMLKYVITETLFLS